ncbi:MAG: hypothetical protein HY816_13750 [Candidatus Wallbacteria bacterium]|nr:hypothetical protein [Candidatus Wallbacteria bacterium]
MAEGRERDLVLAPNEYAYILDETKGNVVAYVGPHKTSMANTDRPVVYDPQTRRYRRSSLEEAITSFPFAEEGWYIVLEDPARPGDEEHPKAGPNSLPRLTPGRKVNLPGPTTFPLWPGQVARVVEGHQLRSNQYLLVKVYNEEAARENWNRAVIKPQRAVSVESTAPATPSAEPDLPELPALTTGQLLIVRGTEVSFYIPPTGIEVVADPSGSHVRSAVTLERLEYCILLDENGSKRFIQGPAVVFPEPTETFVERAAQRKFRAIELNEISGLYIKVIAPYTDERGVERAAGDELFITGRDQMIYYPRPEHAIIKYGEQEVHYAVAIPAGEGRYVLDRISGEIRLHRGPAMLLPDPRREVIVRRILDAETCALLFPDNPAVLEHNRALAALGGDQECEAAPAAERVPKRTGVNLLGKRAEPRDGAAAFAGDGFVRRPGFTAPRTLTLDTRLDGAVAIEVWTGYAVLVVGRSGQRQVIVGPRTHLLEYDETLEPVQLSTGTPKSAERLTRTAYLRALNNRVGDLVEAETSDLCRVRLRLSYCVGFEGDPVQWFQVENYVQFLCDHMRSLLRNVVKRHGIEAFHARAIEVVRDTVLGPPTEAGRRAGRLFEENGMRVFDVEVLDVEVGDETIGKFLVSAQHTAVQQAIRIAQEERQLEVARRSEEIKRLIASTQSETIRLTLGLKVEEVRKQLEMNLAEIESQARAEESRLSATAAQQDALSRITDSELSREKSRQAVELEFQRAQLEQRLQQLRAEVQSVVERAQAVSPDLVAALQAFSDRHLAAKVAETMAPLAILGGKSVAEVFGTLLKDTPLETALVPR